MSSRILFIASLNTKENRFDGERIKSTFIYESMQKQYNQIDLINLSKNKYLQTLKLIFVSLFKKKKYDRIYVSKDPRGGTIIEKILHMCGVKGEKIYYFEIGPLLYDLVLSGKIKKKWFDDNKIIVVETLSMKNDLEKLGFNNVRVFPNFKPKPNVALNDKKYPKSILKLIYFSRIEEKKGIYDLITAVKKINSVKPCFSLDIYGMFNFPEDEEKVTDICLKDEFISYKGKMDLSVPGSYEILEDYDLHVFPTHYGEGFPGSLIDFFFVGVPTVSANFARCPDILSDEDSFIYKQGDIDDLIKTLNFVYENQNEILEKRKKTHDKSNMYTIEAFDTFMEELVNEK